MHLIKFHMLHSQWAPLQATFGIVRVSLRSAVVLLAHLITLSRFVCDNLELLDFARLRWSLSAEHRMNLAYVDTAESVLGLERSHLRVCRQIFTHLDRSTHGRVALASRQLGHAILLLRASTVLSDHLHFDRVLYCLLTRKLLQEHVVAWLKVLARVRVANGKQLGAATLVILTVLCGQTFHNFKSSSLLAVNLFAHPKVLRQLAIANLSLLTVLKLLPEQVLL